MKNNKFLQALFTVTILNNGLYGMLQEELAEVNDSVEGVIEKTRSMSFAEELLVANRESHDNSPRKHRMCWFFAQDGIPVMRAKITGEKQDEWAPNLDAMLDYYNVDTLLLFVESDFLSTIQNPNFNIKIFRLPDTDKVIYTEHVNQFCDFLNECYKKNITLAAYTGGFDSNIYVLLVCWSVTMIINSKIRKDGACEGIKIRSIISAESQAEDVGELREKVINAILEQAYSRVFNATAQSCTTISKQMREKYFSEAEHLYIKLFCLKLLSRQHPALRRASFNDRRSGSGSSQSPRYAVSSSVVSKKETSTSQLFNQVEEEKKNERKDDTL